MSIIKRKRKNPTKSQLKFLEKNVIPNMIMDILWEWAVKNYVIYKICSSNGLSWKDLEVKELDEIIKAFTKYTVERLNSNEHNHLNNFYEDIE